MLLRSPLRVSLVVILLLGVSVAGAGLAERAGPAAAAPNPVQVEMQLLQAAMQSAVAAVAAGDVTGLPRQFHEVHLAAEKTMKATGAGAYVPAKNPDRLARFQALDEAFHKEMITLVKAAKKNDVDTTATQVGVLLTRCHGCHSEFRAAPPASTTAKP